MILDVSLGSKQQEDASKFIVLQVLGAIVIGGLLTCSKQLPFAAAVEFCEQDFERDVVNLLLKSEKSFKSLFPEIRHHIRLATNYFFTRICHIYCINELVNVRLGILLR